MIISAMLIMSEMESGGLWDQALPRKEYPKYDGTWEATVETLMGFLLPVRSWMACKLRLPHANSRSKSPKPIVAANPE